MKINNCIDSVNYNSWLSSFSNSCINTNFIKAISCYFLLTKVFIAFSCKRKLSKFNVNDSVFTLILKRNVAIIINFSAKGFKRIGGVDSTDHLKRAMSR